MPKQPITYNSERYPSIKDCCETLKINCHSVRNYRNRTGCTTIEAINYFVQLKEQGKQRRVGAFTYKGKEYPSLKACCEALEICRDSVRYYQKRTGCTTIEAIDYLHTPRNTGKAQHAETFTYNGIEYSSIRACCEALEIKKGSVYGYIHKTNCTTIEAIDHYVKLKEQGKQHRVGTVTYKSIEYPSLLACCKALGISEGSVREYRKRTACTTIEAIDHFVERKEQDEIRSVETVTYEGIEYLSLKNCCKALGICDDSVRNYRKRTGCTTEEAIDYFLRPRNIQFAYNHRITGELYYECRCPQCKRYLFIGQSMLENFTHSEDFCKRQENPYRRKENG